ncbi:hypothetical protein [Noviherbaspirillum sedimenti]|uniref:hypothetical protein n=1 Tax=Noviherbaspirillum sedimenti TaxID=2320865 RepID=UPI001F239CCF|nr:hypothetical protein [Noviherbaspirillum sedimenti]
MRIVKFDARTLLAMGLLFPALALAEDVPPRALVAASSSPAASTPQESGPQSLAGLGASIAPDSLDQYRGGSVMKSEAVSHGLLQDATAKNVSTGNNSIADGAFAHSIGLPIVIQNSGANVLIQNSTIVNVQFQ